MLSNLDMLQRELVRNHHALIRLLKVRRLSGCRWRDPAAMAAAHAGGPWPEWAAPVGLPPACAAGAAAAGGQTNESDGAAVSAFLRACLVATGNAADKLDVWRTCRDKEPIGGLSVYMAIGSWCAAFGVAEPNMADLDLATLVAGGVGEGVTYTAANVKEVRGVELKDMRDSRNAPRYARQWYMMEALTVVVHLVAMLLLPCICLPLAVNAQYAYAASTAPPGTTPLMWYHVMQLWPDVRHKEVALIVQVLVWLNLAYMAAALLRIFIHYLQLDDRNWFVRGSRKVGRP